MNARAKAYWLVFTNSVSDDEARRRFEAKFGYAAEQVIRENGYVWLGPFREIKTEHLSLCNCGMGNATMPELHTDDCALNVAIAEPNKR